MIIGLTGLKGAGKDTVAAMLVKQYGYERRAFADPLKKSVAALFDIPFVDVDKFKLADDCFVILLIDQDGPTEQEISLTFREFLQRYGTEAHRDVPEFGDDVWIDLTLPHTGYYVDRNIVISDCRFENEARRIHYLKGIVVCVDRAGLVNEDPHRSESGIGVEPDYTIFNNGTIDELETGVRVMFDYFNRVRA